MSSIQPGQVSVALIGTGVMGRSMALNLLRAGYEVFVYSRTRSKAEALLEAGCQWRDSPAEAATSASVAITIVGFPKDVREVYFGVDGQQGILDAAQPGALLIDMTTSEPRLAEEIAAAAQSRGLSALDAPVSGGDVGARQGTLSIMVGGEAEAFSAAEPLFGVLGQTIVHQGRAGAGQHTKMCNQIAIAASMIAVMESLLYARRAGLEPARVLDSISAGAAGSWSLSNLVPRVIAGDLEPGFYVEHFLKDMRIALAEAERLGARLPGLALAERLYQRLADEGGARQGTQAIYRVLEADA